MAAAQECSEAGCSKPAAFKTRTRPAWCDDHITAILWQGGLQPLAPFAKPFAYRLTRCLRCGCEAHYRFEYTLDRNALGEATCRACYWRQWAERTRALQREYAHVTPVPAAEARQHAENNGYDYLEALTRPSLPDDPHRVRCRYCHRVSAQRLADIGWGCSCQVNPRRDRQTSKPTTRSRPNLLKDSDLSAVHWWDHEHNDASLWQTVTVLARREAHWVCPDCTLRFSSRILDMAKAATCPACEPVRRASRQAELERYRVTPVANVPELLEAWADEADPRRVTVAGDPALRRFRCPRGHHPRITPLSYLRSGCPTCRGPRRAKRTRKMPHSIRRRIASTQRSLRSGIRRTTTESGSQRSPRPRVASSGGRTQCAVTNGRTRQPTENAGSACAAQSAARSWTRLPTTSPHWLRNGHRLTRSRHGMSGPADRRLSCRRGSAPLIRSMYGRQALARGPPARHVRSVEYMGSPTSNSSTMRLRLPCLVERARVSPSTVRHSAGEAGGTSTSRPNCRTADW
jgi:hypothetical protein